MDASDISQVPARRTLPLGADLGRDVSRSKPWGRTWWGPSLLGAVALLSILVWLFWDFLAKQVRFAITQQADWGHTLVIPFIAGYFIYTQRDRLLSRPFKTTWIGLLVMIVGVALYMVCTAGPVTLRHHNLQGLSVSIAITGIALLFCGWHAMRTLAFPLAFLFVFSQTISERLLNRVTFEMQDITARGSALLLSLFLDVDRLGNTIYIVRVNETIPLNIAEACSGMRMLMAFLALGTAMAFTGLKYNWQRILLVLLGVPTAIFVNILRVCTLGVLSIADTGFAAGDFHSFVGLLWLIPAFFIYLGLMWVIKRLVIEETSAARSKRNAPSSKPLANPFDSSAKLALIVACCTLIVCSVGFRFAVRGLNIYLQKEPVELRGSFSTIPAQIGQWKQVGEDIVLEDAVLRELGTTDTISRVYAVDGDLSKHVLSLHVAYYTGMIDAVPHIPDRCFVASGMENQSLPEILPLNLDREGWVIDKGPVNKASGEPYHRVDFRHQFTNQLQSVLMPVGDLSIRVTEFADKTRPGLRIFGGFLFIANGRAAATPEEIRMLAFKPSERSAYYCKVQLVAASSSMTQQRYLELCADFMEEFLPELMLRLPDWREVEHSDAQSSSTISPNSAKVDGNAPPLDHRAE